MARLTPIRIVFVFLLFSLCWIYFSDIAVSTFTKDPEIYTKISIAKGFIYVTLTSLFLWTLISLFERQKDRADAALKETERQTALMSFALANVHEAAFLIDHCGRFQYVNGEACRSLEYSREELLAMAVADVDPDFPADRWAGHWEELREKKSLLFDSRHKTRSGRIFPVEVTTNYFEYDGSGFNLALVRDITDRISAREKMREAAILNEQIITCAEEGVIVYGRDLRYWLWNPYMEKLSGKRADEVLGRHPLEVFPFLKDVGVTDRLERALQGETLPTIEFPYQQRDSGGQGWASDTSSPLRNSDGEVIGVIGIVNDITARKQLEIEQQNTKRLLQTIIDTEPECIKLLDSDGNLLMMNRAGLDMIQADTFEQVRGQCVCPLVTSEYREPFMNLTQRVFQGETGILTFEIVGLNGRRLWLETHAVPFRDEHNAVVALLGVTRDVTERRRLEEELFRAQKLESIGLLAGGIAHDFNNLLQGVFGYIAMARLHLDDRKRATEMLDQAEQALGTSINLTGQLLTFSKGGKPIKKRADLRELIENAARFALIGSSSDYRVTTDKPLRSADVDAGQIGQVVQNIVQNAREAMPNGGTVEIAVENVDLAECEHPLMPGGGEFIRIKIKDSGMGIPSQHLSRIFDPYFTTKQKGSGLGLATSYSIIRNHGGTIEVTSELNAGTTFLIYLPAGSEEEARQEKPRQERTAARKGRVLFMDDEELLRNLTREMLTTLGHEVECAASGSEAISKYRDALISGRRFDVVILDLTVRGGMGGEEAMKELLKIDPSITAVVSSGYADGASMAEYEAHGFKACLKKPYGIAALSDILGSLLTS